MDDLDRELEQARQRAHSRALRSPDEPWTEAPTKRELALFDRICVAYVESRIKEWAAYPGATLAEVAKSVAHDFVAARRKLVGRV